MSTSYFFDTNTKEFQNSRQLRIILLIRIMTMNMWTANTANKIRKYETLEGDL